jgi:hypothetical protein
VAEMPAVRQPLCDLIKDQYEQLALQWLFTTACGGL